MKYYYTWLLISLGSLMPLSSQTLVNWPLTTSELGYATEVADGILGIDFERGNGLGILNYSGSGVSANNWAALVNEEAHVDYYEFGLIAKANQTIDVSELQFSERRSSSGPLKFRIAYSKNGFATSTVLTTVTLSDNIFSRNHAFPVDVKIADGEELRFRIYGNRSESPSGSWTINKNSLALKGQTMTSCSPPTSPASVYVNTIGTNSFEAVITGGSGQGRLVVVGPEQFDFPVPYQGEAYVGNTTYGSGDCLAGSTHVIRSTTSSVSTITVDGLEPGGMYQLAIFEYDLAGMCYNSEPTIIDIVTECTPTPQTIERLRFTNNNRQVAIDWERVNCYDKYLLVASEQPIVGAPVGISFEDLPNFGEGDPANGFGPGVYPVFYGENYNQITVKELDNGTTYYFAMYTRVGSHWSSAYRFEATPEDACRRQAHERIFINEFHYANNVISQDQGVEIAGPAGIDLSNYEIVLNVSTGGLNNLHFPIHNCLLNGEIDDEGQGMGAVWFPMPNIPQTRGKIELVNNITGDVVDFVQYDPNYGVRDAFTPPGTFLINPFLHYSDLAESSLSPAGYSLQRTGEGTCPVDFLWSIIPHSRGTLNVGQLILPVELTLLGAEAKGEAARVYWQTTREENSDYFIVEHSTDGRYFSQLGKVKASGFSETLVDYQFYDYKPSNGINYYRLKQQDYDGTIHDHGIVTVNFNGTGKETLLVFPNPVDRQATISWEGEAEILKLSDSQGRLLRSISLDDQQQGGSRSMDLSNLPQGAYFLRLEGRDRIETFTAIKK